MQILKVETSIKTEVEQALAAAPVVKLAAAEIQPEVIKLQALAAAVKSRDKQALAAAVAAVRQEE